MYHQKLGIDFPGLNVCTKLIIMLSKVTYYQLSTILSLYSQNDEADQLMDLGKKLWWTHLLNFYIFST